VLVFAVVSFIFVFGALFAGRFLRPKHPTMVKAETYECGEPVVGSGWINFNMRFCLIALIFVIFDVEVALLFPVLAVYKKWISLGSGGLALVEVGLFVFILFLGLVYAWSRGDLEWVKKIS
jgi:NADH-quinone oxidoreductase subunit A